MNNMKLIMENWRKFSDELHIDEKTILVETKNKSYTLENLIIEHTNKKISTELFNSILLESIEKDLEAINELDLKQTAQNVAGAVKTGYEKVKTGLKAIDDKILEIYVSAVAKMRSMIKTGAAKVIPYAVKLANFISPKNMSPETKRLLINIITLIVISGIIYIIFGANNAQAAVKLTTQGQEIVIDQNSKDVLNAINDLLYGPAGVNMDEDAKQNLVKLARGIRKTGLVDLDPESMQGPKEAVETLLNQIQLQKQKQGLPSTLANVVNQASEIGKEALNTVTSTNAPRKLGQINLLDMDANSIIELVKDQWPAGAAKTDTNLAKMAYKLGPALAKKTGMHIDKVTDILQNKGI